MKKSHEYDSPVLSRIVSIVTVFAICICSVCCCLCCYKMSSLSVATSGAAVSNGNNSSNNSSNNNSNNNSSNNNSSNNNNSSTPAGEDVSNAGGADATAGETDPAKVVAKYTEVMNNLKAKVGTYEKKEFQTLPEDKYDLGTLGSVILPIAQNFLTTEDKAEIQKRDDAKEIPVISNTKGCLLTDMSAVKSASMVENGGKTTITLVLNDEENPEPAKEAATSPSIVGTVFNPLSKADIDKTLAGIKAIKVNSFNLTYHDCTATLVFDTATGNVESLQQIMNIHIVANVKAVVVTIDGYAELINTMTINNIKYK